MPTSVQSKKLVKHLTLAAFSLTLIGIVPRIVRQVMCRYNEVLVTNLENWIIPNSGNCRQSMKVPFIWSLASLVLWGLCVFMMLAVFVAEWAKSKVYEEELNKDVEKAAEGVSELKSGFEEAMKEHQETAKFAKNKMDQCFIFYGLLIIVYNVAALVF